jgi:transcriptional regulator with XRE-family HTH domain
MRRASYCQYITWQGGDILAGDIMTRLRVLRAEKDVSQQAAAKGAGISFRAYNSIENGKADPTMNTLILLSNYFGVTVDYLIGRSERRGD